MAQGSSALFSDSYAPDLSDVYPFRKFYSKGNPVQRCLLIIGIILASLKVLSRVIFDIDYGAPESFEECLVMAVYYLSDLLIGLIFYLIASFILSRIFQEKSR